MEETTIFFGKIAGAYFLVTGLGLLISTEFYEKMVRGNASTDPVTLNLSGAVHFLVGLVIVIQHIRWARRDDSCGGLPGRLLGSVLATRSLGAGNRRWSRRSILRHSY